MKKRTKKEVFVYEKGIELLVMLGELTEDQVNSCGLKLNKEKTIHMRELMLVIKYEIKKNFYPNSFISEDEVQCANWIIKHTFSEIVKNINFNNEFYGLDGELWKAHLLIIEGGFKQD